MKLTMTACINASQQDVWKVLSDISNVDLWVDPILSAYCEHDNNKGIGTVRVCKLKGNMSVRETWTDWDEGKSFTYIADETALFKSAKNTWSLTREKGKTLITTESEMIIKGGFLGKLFEPLMKLASKKMGADSLAALTYLVENGKPYSGKFSKLPKVPIIC